MRIRLAPKHHHESSEGSVDGIFGPRVVDRLDYRAIHAIVTIVVQLVHRVNGIGKDDMYLVVLGTWKQTTVHVKDDGSVITGAYQPFDRIVLMQLRGIYRVHAAHILCWFVLFLFGGRAFSAVVLHIGKKNGHVS